MPQVGHPVHHPLWTARAPWAVDQERISRLFDRRRCLTRSGLNPIAGNDLVLYLCRANCGLSMPAGRTIVPDLEGKPLSLSEVQADSIRRKELPVMPMLKTRNPCGNRGFELWFDALKSR